MARRRMDDLLTYSEASAEAGASVTQLHRMVADGLFPLPLILSPRNHRFRWLDVEAWKKARDAGELFDPQAQTAQPDLWVNDATQRRMEARDARIVELERTLGEARKLIESLVTVLAA